MNDHWMTENINNSNNSDRFTRTKKNIAAIDFFFHPWKLCHQMKYCYETFCVVFFDGFFYAIVNMLYLGHSFFFTYKNDIQMRKIRQTKKKASIDFYHYWSWFYAWYRWMEKSIKPNGLIKIIWHWLTSMVEFCLHTIPQSVSAPIYF